MALPNEVGDREKQKFVEDDFGKVAVRTQDSNVNAISGGNTSTTVLGVGATFTGVWSDVSGYDAVTVSVQTNADGQLRMQFSESASPTRPTVETKFHVEGGEFQSQKLPVVYRYYRTVYENDGSAQTAFSLTTLLGGRPDPTGEPVILRHNSGKDVYVRLRNGIYELAAHDAQMHQTMKDILLVLNQMNCTLTEMQE